MSNDGSGVDASRLSLLKRIAEILEIPVGAPFGPEETNGDRLASTVRGDVRAMLTAFVRIGDPDRRRACLDYVLEIADAEAGRADDGGPDRA